MSSFIKKTLTIIPLLLCLTLAKCHPYSLTFCRIYVSDHYVIANLTVPLEDLILFQYIGVDSTRTYTIEEINQAGAAYKQELAKTFSVKNERGALELDELDFYTSSLDTQTILWADLLKNRLEYTFKYKLDTGAKELMISQNFGEKFPLIPALMILEVDGKLVQNNQFDLMKGAICSLSLSQEDQTNRETNIFINMEDSIPSCLLRIPAGQLASIIGENYAASSDSNILGRLIEMTMDDTPMIIRSIQSNQNDKTSLHLFSFPLSKKPQARYELLWKSFNRKIRNISVIVQWENHQETFQLTRFNERIFWSDQ
ncbi:MAG: hypothetical protein DHS20C18_28670 [Saprospiraceae bacterium]|nr:MAG: hypothetical protein DHS20C18_28670 [Saprospiraceae bacterium]